MGARRDPHFGAIVMVGLGGIAVEISDVALAPAPVSAERARAMLATPAPHRLLTGVRGRPPLDVAAVADRGGPCVVAGRRSRPAARRLEVNGLIVRRQGQGAVAVDGRATLGPGKGGVSSMSLRSLVTLTLRSRCWPSRPLRPRACCASGSTTIPTRSIRPSAGPTWAGSCSPRCATSSSTSPRISRSCPSSPSVTSGRPTTNRSSSSCARA